MKFHIHYTHALSSGKDVTGVKIPAEDCYIYNITLSSGFYFDTWNKLTEVLAHEMYAFFLFLLKL